MKLCIFFLLAAAGIAAVHSTTVSKCRGAKIDPPSSQDISIQDCTKPPCRLRKRTEPAIVMKIRPSTDVPGLITRVSAEIATVLFPFIGVDGTSACGLLYEEDGKTKASCPLKAGTTYVYKNKFKILDFYPKVNLNILWGLVNNKTKEYVSCFELPARIG